LVFQDFTGLVRDLVRQVVPRVEHGERNPLDPQAGFISSRIRSMVRNRLESPSRA